MILYQVFKPVDGVMSRTGHATRFLDRAVARASALQGEVRPLGSLTPVWQAQTFITTPMTPAKPTPMGKSLRVAAPPAPTTPAKRYGPTPLACSLARPPRRKRKQCKGRNPAPRRRIPHPQGPNPLFQA
jgi:hypothetical protein